MNPRLIGGTDCATYLDVLVEAAPPLSAYQRDRLRGLFRSRLIGTASAKVRSGPPDLAVPDVSAQEAA